MRRRSSSGGSSGVAVGASALVALLLAVLAQSTWTARGSPSTGDEYTTIPITPVSEVIPRAAWGRSHERPSGRLAARAGSSRMPRPEPAMPTASRAEAEVNQASALASRGAAGAAEPGDPGSRAPADGSVPQLMICHLDARGPFGAAEALQECIARAPAFSSVEIPPGTYLFTRQVIVSTPLTIRTAGSANTSLSCAGGSGRCAVLLAGPDLLDAYGLLLIRSTNNVTLEHLVLDGNRGARLSSIAARWCETGNAAPGFNAAVLECASCGLDDVVSSHALCGTGMVWSGPQALIERSRFSANGDAGARGMWADGLTLVYAPYSEIRQNQFVDNSDIGLIVGYAVGSRIEGNLVRQRVQPAFAGLMLDNFNSDNLGFRGDFRGAVIAGNLIDCGAHLCVFGIQAGPRPWYATTNIVGGDLHGNEIRGAKVGINVDGAGTVRAPIAIFANTVSDVPAGSYFSECARAIPTEWMNVSPASVVDRRDERVPTGGHVSDPCQLWSDLAPDDR